jgi:hypothetical protein
VAGALSQCLAHLQHPGLAPQLPRLPDLGPSRWPLARRPFLGAGGTHDTTGEVKLWEVRAR